MFIGNVEIKNNLFLAPMAGVTDHGFRRLCKEYGAGLTYTEMVSVKALFHKSRKTENLLMTTKIESPCAVQLFGHEPKVFEKVLKSDIFDKFDIIDINMGCPAPKIVKNGDGSALLKNIDLAKEIIQTCVKSTTKPVTVKFRCGYNLDENIAVEFAKMCEEAGASAITIHPRTREQFYSGRADYQIIKQVKRAVNIPVIGNGDVTDKKSYDEILKSECDAVMIGRGALGKPEIFSLLQNKKVKVDRLKMIKQHLSDLEGTLREPSVVSAFRKHLLWYVSGYNDAVKIKTQLMSYTTYKEVFECLEQFFKNRTKK